MNPSDDFTQNVENNRPQRGKNSNAGSNHLGDAARARLGRSGSWLMFRAEPAC
jgi:hypothetical protein